MKIKIKSIYDRKVEFETEYGSAIGIWKDETPPEMKEYIVELDIRKLIKYSDINVSNIDEPRIELVSKGILITALLLEYDFDGCATLKLGDSLLEVETIYSPNFISMCGHYVLFLVSDIDIYDEHIFWL